MNAPTASKWQYSLRSLLLVMMAAAVIATIWRIFGSDSLVWSAFVVLSTAPLLKVVGLSKRAYLISWLAVYAPFVIMATYTYFFVSCSHCKETTWAVLPYAPE